MLTADRARVVEDEQDDRGNIAIHQQNPLGRALLGRQQRAQTRGESRACPRRTRSVQSQCMLTDQGIRRGLQDGRGLLSSFERQCQGGPLCRARHGRRVWLGLFDPMDQVQGRECLGQRIGVEKPQRPSYHPYRPQLTACRRPRSGESELRCSPIQRIER